MGSHIAKHDELHQCVFEHNSRLVHLDGQLQDQAPKFESLATQIFQLDGQVSTKADSTSVHTKEFVDERFREVYRKDEIDAMLSRVWWRVGEISKVKVSTPFPIRA